MSTNDDLIILDGRQSVTAASVQRGVCRMLRDVGHATICEFTLPTGRRPDVLSIGEKGEIWIIEIKSSLADFQADHKWHEYWDFCDQLFFARPLELDAHIFPSEAGLIVADAFGAEISRFPTEKKLSAARRKALTLRVARAASMRLQTHFDPNS